MKNFFLILAFLQFFFCSAQKSFVLKDFQNGKEFVKKDSASAVKFLDSLAENNYYFTKILSVKKQNNTTEILFDKGKNYNNAWVKVSPDVAKKITNKEYFLAHNLDSLKKSVNRTYISEGFAFNRVKTKFFGWENDIPKVELSVNTNDKRTIDGFVLKGYDRVPRRFVKNLQKEFGGKIYDEKNLIAINQSLQNHPYISLDRPPQTLFTKDSTQIFLFVQKKKANTFDGVLGFGNDKTQKFTLNGTLDVSFRNIFNGFESLNMYWQRTADKGQTFNLNADVPYLFGSNLGANLKTNIIRQDSAYATAKIFPSVYYNINNRMKIGLRGSFETSTVSAANFISGQDFNKKGVGVWFEFFEPTEIPLFQFQTRFRAEADLLKTVYASDISANQKSYFISAERNFHITGNNYFNVKGEAAMLESGGQSFAENELLRFGGWNSLRGFNENSLYASQYYFAGLEYRYLIGNQAFFDVFGQYGNLKNITFNSSPKFYTYGAGFNFFLPIGLMSFQISSGNQSGIPTKFSDTKIHWGILSKF